MLRRLPVLGAVLLATVTLVVACDSSSFSSETGFDAGDVGAFEAGAADGPSPGADAGRDSSRPADASAEAEAEAGKVLPSGLADPIPYTSRADSPFNGVAFPAYFHFEDWEDGLVNTPGVTPSSTTVSSSFGATLIDSIDGDDGVVDGKCEKAAGACEAGFGNGTIDFTFDAGALGALPTHVGIAWTDGAPGCDAVFEAYDAADVLIGTKTAAAVGDAVFTGTVAEDRFFSVVHGAGVKRIVIKSSSGGLEVDHLQYGR